MSENNKPETFKVQRIVNGFIFTDPEGETRYVKDGKALGDWFTDQLTQELEDLRHCEWDGKFELTFGARFNPPSK